MISLPELRRCPRLRRSYPVQVIALRPEAPEKKITIARGRTVEVGALGLTFDNADANWMDVGVEVEVSLVLPRGEKSPAPFFPALLEGKGRVTRIENRVSGTNFRQRITVVLDAPLRFDVRPKSAATTCDSPASAGPPGSR